MIVFLFYLKKYIFHITVFDIKDFFPFIHLIDVSCYSGQRIEI